MRLGLDLALSRPGGVPFYADATVALDFANSRYRNGLGAPVYADPSLVSGWSYSRTGTEYEATSSGLLVPFASGVPAVTDLGLQVWEARTNKNTNTNVNPQSTTNAVKGGDAAATLTVVDDTAKLASIGLSGNVFKLDNSAGTGLAWATLGGLTGNTNAHSMSAWVRGSATGATLEYNGGSGGTSFTPATNYTRIKGENKTSPATTAQMVVTVNAGGVVFFIGNNFEEAAFAGPLTPVSGASATRGAASASVTNAPGTAGWIYAEWVQPSAGIVNNRIVGTTNAVGEPGPLFINSTGVGTYNGAVGLTATATLTGGNTVKGVVTWDATGRAVVANGGTPASDAGSIGSWAALLLGTSVTPTNNTLNSQIRRVTAGSTRLTTGQMQSMTQ